MLPIQATDERILRHVQAPRLHGCTLHHHLQPGARPRNTPGSM